MGPTADHNGDITGEEVTENASCGNPSCGNLQAGAAGASSFVDGDGGSDQSNAFDGSAGKVERDPPLERAGGGGEELKDSAAKAATSLDSDGGGLANGRAAPDAPQNPQHSIPDSNGDDGNFGVDDDVDFGVSTITGLLEARDAAGVYREVYLKCTRCEGTSSRVSYFTLANPANGKARCYVCGEKCSKRTTAFKCEVCLSWAHFNCFAKDGTLQRALDQAVPVS